MRLYKKLVPRITKDVVEALIQENVIEVEPGNEDEVELDVEAVLNEYLRVDREISEEARDLQADKGLSFGKAKSKVAERKGVGVGDDSVGYIIDQIIEMFFHSNFVEEIYAPDHDIRKLLAPILRDHMSVEEELKKEAEEKTKNLEKGTREWEVEYQKVMERLKRTKDLE